MSLGDPEPEITWQKAEQILTPLTNKRVTIDWDVKQGRCVLTITAAVPDDEGLYRLEAVNEAGFMAVTMLVKMDRKETVSTEESDSVQARKTRLTDDTEPLRPQKEHEIVCEYVTEEPGKVVLVEQDDKSIKTGKKIDKTVLIECDTEDKSEKTLKMKIMYEAGSEAFEDKDALIPVEAFEEPLKVESTQFVMTIPEGPVMMVPKSIIVESPVIIPPQSAAEQTDISVSITKEKEPSGLLLDETAKTGLTPGEVPHEGQTGKVPEDSVGEPSLKRTPAEPLVEALPSLEGSWVASPETVILEPTGPVMIPPGAILKEPEGPVKIPPGVIIEKPKEKEEPRKEHGESQIIFPEEVAKPKGPEPELDMKKQDKSPTKKKLWKRKSEEASEESSSEDSVTEEPKRSLKPKRSLEKDTKEPPAKEMDLERLIDIALSKTTKKIPEWHEPIESSSEDFDPDELLGMPSESTESAYTTDESELLGCERRVVKRHHVVHMAAESTTEESEAEGTYDTREPFPLEIHRQVIEETLSEVSESEDRHHAIQTRKGKEELIMEESSIRETDEEKTPEPENLDGKTYQTESEISAVPTDTAKKVEESEDLQPVGTPSEPRIEVAPLPVTFEEGSEIVLSCRVTGQHLLVCHAACTQWVSIPKSLEHPVDILVASSRRFAIFFS